jgi:hypothetical protein
MKIIYLLLLCVLSAIAGASHVYILAAKTLSTFEFCMFACFASVDLLLFSFAAANLVREI